MQLGIEAAGVPPGVGVPPLWPSPITNQGFWLGWWWSKAGLLNFSGTSLQVTSAILPVMRGWHDVLGDGSRQL